MLGTLRIIRHLLTDEPPDLRRHQPPIFVYVPLPGERFDQRQYEHTAILGSHRGLSFVGRCQHLDGAFFRIVLWGASPF
jgi:hypothetical protein